VNTATRAMKWQALGLLVAIVSSGAACSSGDSSPTGTGGGGGATGGSGGSGSGGTTGTGGSGGSSGGTSGGLLNAGQCGERGTATVNATTYNGSLEYFIIGDGGLGADVCVVKFDVARVGAAPAGCTGCNWSHLVELSNPTVVTNVNGACDANDGVPAIDAAGRTRLTGSRSARGFSHTTGHGDALMKYDDAKMTWDGVGRANWDEAASALGYNISTGNCMYGR